MLADPPFKPIAVGVMAHNEAATIERCLRAILEQDAPVTSVVVVASGCTDATPDIVRDLMREFDQLSLITEPARSGKAAAINKFIAATAEPILVLIGGDVVMAPGAIAAMVEPYHDPEVGMTGARPLPTNSRRRLTGRVVHLLWELHHEVSLTSPKLGEAVSFRRCFSALDPTTLVDEASIEGLVRAKGLRLAYAPDAVVYNHGPETFSDLLTQRVRINEGHQVLARRTGYRPSTARSVPLAPMLIRYARRHPDKALDLGAAAAIEVLARMLAAGRSLRGGRDGLWKPISTSKLVLRDGHRMRLPQFESTQVVVEDVAPAPPWALPGWVRTLVHFYEARWRRQVIDGQLRDEDAVRAIPGGVEVTLRASGPSAQAATSRLLNVLSEARRQPPAADPGGRFQFFKASAWLTGTLLAFNISNYLLNILLSRMVSKSTFGEIAGLLSLAVVVSVPTSGIQAFATREESAARAAGRPGPGADLARSVTWWTLVAASVAIAISPLLAWFLHLDSVMPAILVIAAAAIGLPVALRRGVLQGATRFPVLAGTVGLEGALRLLGALVLVYLGLGAAGVAAAFAVAGLAALVMASRATRGELSRRSLEAKAPASGLLPILAGLAALTVLFNLDVVLARHFLSPREAGDYASISLMGRVLFYLTSAVTGALLAAPLAAAALHRRLNLIGKALLVVVGTAIVGEAFYIVAAEPIMTLVFGPAYGEAAENLPLIGLGIVALSATNLLVYVLFALRRSSFLAILPAMIVLEVGLAAWHHRSARDIALALALPALVGLVGTAILAAGAILKTPEAAKGGAG